MYAFELFEQQKPRVVVTYPGRFQPFHQGHAGVFAQLQKRFGSDNVYILTSNDTSSAKSPFNFSDKYQLITASGIPNDRIVETNRMYILPEQFDPTKTIFVTAVGAPDADRLNPNSVTKRDQKDKDGNITKPAGSPSYYKTLDANEQPVTADQHGYVVVIPEIKKTVSIGGQQYDASHGTEVRALWNMVRNDPAKIKEFLTQLYARPNQELVSIYNKIPEATAEDVMPANGDTTSPIHGGQVYEQGVAEAFDKPYKGKWEKSEYGDVDLNTKLPDGTYLNIMFNQQQDSDGEAIVQVEFYRNNSQEVTGEGDAMRVFATVLTAIQQYVKKYKPARLSFSASKQVEPGQNTESRAKLYDRLVQRYAKAWGYRAFRADNGDLVIYELSRLKQGVAEGNLNEFAPGSGSGDDSEDPYKYPKPESYRRSADFFGKFEAGHFDREDFDDATGVFKGYWGSTQIAYFKFDNPAKTGSDDPGMGWYYEPESSASNDTTSAKPAAFDNSEQRKQQELGMIDAFLKSGQTPKPGGQIHSMMKRHGLAEGNDDVWGPQGNFAGDKPVNLGGSVSKKLDVNDTVTYFGEKATILAMSKDRTVSRIHLKSGITQNVKTSDLKRVGQDVAEGSEQRWRVTVGTKTGGTSHTMTFNGTKEQAIKKAVARFGTSKNPVVTAELVKRGVAEEQLDEACWKGYHKEGNKKMFGKTYPNCVKNKNESLETYIRKGECPGCGGAMISESELTEKQDACYHKVKSRYKVWPSAYASGALVQCRKKGAANWGNKSESITQEEYDQLDENLKKWFSDKWVRFGPDGKIRGDCARGDSSEGKPKCLPQSKAHALGKKGRASAAARKRRQDPNPERKGAAINVATKKKTNEGASGVIATKKQAKDPRYSMSLTKDVRPGQVQKNLRAFNLIEDANESMMFELLKSFLPIAMKELKLDVLPPIKIIKHVVPHQGQATFGRYLNGSKSIEIALSGRHPVDILRTLAHELVHFKQHQLDQLDAHSGETGSNEENEANAVAGIIMRHFNIAYPNAVELAAIDLK